MKRILILIYLCIGPLSLAYSQTYTAVLNPIHFFSKTPKFINNEVTKQIFQEVDKSGDYQSALKQLNPAQRDLYLWTTMASAMSNYQNYDKVYLLYKDGYKSEIEAAMASVGSYSAHTKCAAKIFDKMKTDQKAKRPFDVSSYENICLFYPRIFSSPYITEYIRKHKKDLLQFNDGLDYPLDFSGTIDNWKADSSLRYQLLVEKGEPVMLEEFLPKGGLRNSTTFHPNRRRHKILSYYGNGKTLSEGQIDSTNKPSGGWLIFHDNGNVFQRKFYSFMGTDSVLVQYYPSGKKSFEYHYGPTQSSTEKRGYDEKGNMTYENGNGHYTKFTLKDTVVYKSFYMEEENHKRHGVFIQYKKGKKWRQTPYSYSKKEGTEYYYYDNERVKKEMYYADNKRTGFKYFPKFDRFKVDLELTEDLYYGTYAFIDQKDPYQFEKVKGINCTNCAEVLKQLISENDFLENPDCFERNITLSPVFTIDKTGAVASLELSNLNLYQMDRKRVKKQLESLQFKKLPKSKKGKKLTYRIHLSYQAVEQ